ncbi:MAG: hypothetical protein AAFO82_06825, partial [Bacteroidota bacterium]
PFLIYFFTSCQIISWLLQFRNQIEAQVVEQIMVQNKNRKNIILGLMILFGLILAYAVFEYYSTVSKPNYKSIYHRLKIKMMGLIYFLRF